MEVIVHVTGRDRNLLGLHSALMGAHLLGIRSVLAVTGDPVAVGGESGASNVFDLNSIGLLKLLDALNQGRNLYGAELGGTTRFLAGCAFNPNVADLDGQLRKLEKKLAAGARFVQTQPVFDPRVLERLLAATRPLNVPVLVGLMPLVGERNAEFLHNEVPGIVLPDEVRKRMRGTSGAAGVRAGMAICRELLEEGKRLGVGGYYLIPPFGRVELAEELISGDPGRLTSSRSRAPLSSSSNSSRQPPISRPAIKMPGKFSPAPRRRISASGAGSPLITYSTKEIPLMRSNSLARSQ